MKSLREQMDDVEALAREAICVPCWATASSRAVAEGLPTMRSLDYYVAAHAAHVKDGAA